ncbi:MAG: hypothetical protein KGI54_16865 [Pseudomonadota bacterium]|nr:hypothetical protein [Pseudomonadota bacterium]
MDNTVALNIKTPTMQQALQPLSSIMNLAATAAAIRGQNISNVANQQNLNELNNVRAWSQNPANLKNVTNPDGTFNQQAFLQAISPLAPTKGPELVQHFIDAQKAGTAAIQAKQNLTDSTKSAIGTLFSSLANNPGLNPAMVASAAQNLKEMYPNAAPMIDYQMKYGIGPNLGNPQALKQSLLNVGLAAMPTNTQIGAITPAMVNTGGSLQNINPASNASSIPLTVAPSQMQTLAFDAKNNPIVTTKNPQGEITNVSGAPVNGQPPVAPQVIPQGETPATFLALENLRNESNTAAAAVPQIHFNNQQILSILQGNKGDLEHITGPLAAPLAKLEASLPGSPEFADSFNRISHFLALQNQANEKAMGVSTDLGRSVLAIATGSTAQSPASLETAVKVNDATATGLMFFNQGIEAAAQKGIPNIRTFRNQWTENYSPTAMMLYNAAKNGDKKEINQIITQEGGKDSARMKNILERVTNLEKLTQQGHL